MAPAAPPPAAAPGNAPPKPLGVTPLAVAVMLEAVTVPLDAVLPWMTTVSPGWMLPTLLEALRVTLELSLVLTLTVVPSAEVT